MPTTPFLPHLYQLLGFQHRFSPDTNTVFSFVVSHQPELSLADTSFLFQSNSYCTPLISAVSNAMSLYWYARSNTRIIQSAFNGQTIIVWNNILFPPIPHPLSLSPKHLSSCPPKEQSLLCNLACLPKSSAFIFSVKMSCSSVLLNADNQYVDWAFGYQRSFDGNDSDHDFPLSMTSLLRLCYLPLCESGNWKYPQQFLQTVSYCCDSTQHPLHKTTD